MENYEIESLDSDWGDRSNGRSAPQCSLPAAYSAHSRYAAGLRRCPRDDISARRELRPRATLMAHCNRLLITSETRAAIRQWGRRGAYGPGPESFRLPATRQRSAPRDVRAASYTQYGSSSISLFRRPCQ